jgi:hypothetical protein
VGVKPDEEKKYNKYGMGCNSCHTRHVFSKAEAQKPQACQTCHMGFDHPQWEMWSSSKHGSIALSGTDTTGRAPVCQTCHMHGGDHGEPRGASWLRSAEIASGWAIARHPQGAPGAGSRREADSRLRS